MKQKRTYVELALEHTYVEFLNAYEEFKVSGKNSAQLKDILHRRASLMRLRIEELEEQANEIVITHKRKQSA